LRKNEKGFTLVEIIVVLAIIAILYAITIPSMIGLISSSQEKSAIVECRRVVQAAQATAVEQYAQDIDSLKNIKAASSDILLLAEVSGQIVDIDCVIDNGFVIRLIYHVKNGKYVLFEENTYTVYEDTPNLNTVVNYLKTNENLLEEAASMSGNVWDNLRNLYKEEYDGEYPSISEEEKNILSGVSTASLATLTWKPIILGDNGINGVMMICSSSTSINNAYLIYYDGSYYYHENGYGTKDTSWISDKGTFNTSLLTNPSSSGSRWIKVK